MTAGNVSSFSPFTIGSTSDMNVLPITLLSFVAAKQGSQTYLDWVVAGDEGVSMYVVERSSDGNHFIPIKSVNSVNAAIQHTYSVYDRTPLNGANYYRLKTVDMAGKATYSNVIVINFENQNSYIIYPNPAKNYVNIQSPIAGTINIYNINGALVKTEILEAGMNKIDISKLSSGMYVVLINGQKIEFMKE